MGPGPFALEVNDRWGLTPFSFLFLLFFSSFFFLSFLSFFFLRPTPWTRRGSLGRGLAGQEGRGKERKRERLVLGISPGLHGGEPGLRRRTAAWSRGDGDELAWGWGALPVADSHGKRLSELHGDEGEVV